MVKSLLSAIHQALDLISNQKWKSTDLTFSVVAERLHSRGQAFPSALTVSSFVFPY